MKDLFDYLLGLVGIIGAIGLAALGWAFQLSNRVAVLEQRDTDLIALIEARFGSVNQRLDRIEVQLDRLAP